MRTADRVAAWVVGHVVGTIWFVWFCLMLALFPLLVPRYMPAVQFVSSGVLQLVLLPIILIGQNLQGQQAEARRTEIEQAALVRHQEREDRAARNHDEVLARVEGTLKHVERLCEGIAQVTGGVTDGA